ncbi:A/G-specific adenine glycosylase [Algivirga pacifica]|uniref:Adenine DNA glycosylase n=1 Tax=Algivirga pacifica TaxID=1162670 RepID=A0ABP9DBA1_9BACT
MKIQETGFARELITWYRAHKRDLPWRETKDPYKIWLSEIILQQTRVQQGLPYYQNFVSTYPTVFDLANAAEEEVLRLWQGLGYYSRARNLHATAKYIAEELNGTFPTSYKELLKLKGVGKYTAAAIASFAYQEAVASVDGNVYRVLSRVFGVSEDIASGRGQRYFQELANELIPHDLPDLFNQALMEFGAMHCTPKKPACTTCPFVTVCEAYQHEMVDKLPVKTKKVKTRRRVFNYFVFKGEGTVLMQQRTGKDIWQGLFEFFLIEDEKFITFAELLSAYDKGKEIRSVMEETPAVISYSKAYKHILSHQKLEVQFVLVEVSEKKFLKSLLTTLGLRNLTIEEVQDVPKPILIENYLDDYVY